jgi:hypothetical protein
MCAGPWDELRTAPAKGCDAIGRLPSCGSDTAISAFLQPPLYNTAYGEGFGTMYTAAYRPKDGVVDYVWPGSTWRRGFDSPDGTHEAIYRPHLT